MKIISLLFLICCATNVLAQQNSSTQKEVIYSRKDGMATKTYQPINDEAERRTMDSLVSPIYHITTSSPPIYIVHGNADKTVPIQQSQLFIKQYKALGLSSTFIIKQGVDHDLKGVNNTDVADLITWLNKTNGIN